VKAALASAGGRGVVVLGHMAAEVKAAIRPGRADIAPALRGTNPDLPKAQHLGAHRIAALAKDIDAAIVQLGDMPGRSTRACSTADGRLQSRRGVARSACRRRRQRGNPVLWDRASFAEMANVEGDTGAKHLIGEHADLVCEVE